jgi:2-hydroxy-6-oxonona-2,4-dienedioate hydrolase
VSDGARLGEAAAAWARTRRIEAGGHAVRYREAGDGPVLVMVHGLGCSADYWVRNGPWLAAGGLRVIAPDLPGFGRTRGPEGGLSIPGQAAAVARFADALALPSAAYLGHSLSCQAVLELAASRPERVAALLLAAPTGDRRSKRWARESLGLLRDVPREPPSLVPLIAQAYLRAGFTRWLRTWLAGKRHDAFAAAARVRAPALVLVGDRDPVVSVPFGAALAGALPRGTLQVVPGGTHAVIYSAAPAFNGAVSDFLASLRV